MPENWDHREQFCQMRSMADLPPPERAEELWAPVASGQGSRRQRNRLERLKNWLQQSWTLDCQKRR